jgi:hypothetical protein
MIPAQAAKAMPRLLRGSPALAQWTLAGGAAARAPLAWRWQLRWHAWWAQRLWKLQLPRLAAARPAQVPLLVLGLWRSGTTLLHERLTALPGHQAVKTWQCFNPSGFLLTGAPRDAASSARRPMDLGMVRADTPQEDEFALLLQGAPSLYRGFVDPRRLLALADEHFGPTTTALPGWTADWLRFLAGVEADGGGARLVLKSPNHTLRLPELQAALPGSPQVWIGRPLSAVWSSNLRMWRSMFDLYALWPCPEGALEAFLARCVQRYLQTLSAQLVTAPDTPRLWVDFDDLGAAATPLQQALATFCGGAAALCTAEQQKAVLASHPVHAQTASPSALPAALQPLAAEVDDLHAAARARWGWRSTTGLPA